MKNPEPIQHGILQLNAADRPATENAKKIFVRN